MLFLLDKRLPISLVPRKSLIKTLDAIHDSQKNSPDRLTLAKPMTVIFVVLWCEIVQEISTAEDWLLLTLSIPFHSFGLEPDSVWSLSCQRNPYAPEVFSWCHTMGDWGKIHSNLRRSDGDNSTDEIPVWQLSWIATIPNLSRDNGIPPWIFFVPSNPQVSLCHYSIESMCQREGCITQPRTSTEPWIRNLATYVNFKWFYSWWDWYGRKWPTDQHSS